MYFSKTASVLSMALLAAGAPILNTRQSGPGVQLKNAGTLPTEYCFYNNIWNGDGTAGPNYDNPSPCVTLAPGAQQFVPLSSTFAGRIQRTQTQLGATWVELQTAAANDGHAHGDVSIEQGCDGPATIASTDGTNVVGGFTNEIVSNAPAGSTYVRPIDGQTVLASTAGNWNGQGNQAAVSYAQSVLDATKVYILGGTGVDDVASSNNIMDVTFY